MSRWKGPRCLALWLALRGWTAGSGTVNRHPSTLTKPWNPKLVSSEAPKDLITMKPQPPRSPSLLDLESHKQSLASSLSVSMIVVLCKEVSCVF